MYPSIQLSHEVMIINVHLATKETCAHCLLIQCSAQLFAPHIKRNPIFGEALCHS